MSEWLERPWWIVGAGRLGRALGCAAGGIEVDVAGVWNRTEDRARASRRLVGAERASWGGLEEALSDADLAGAVVWLTVVDEAVEEVAERIAPAVEEAALVVHASGSLGAELLRGAGIASPVGTIHPLLAVSDPERAVEQFGDVAWTVEGDAEAEAFASAFLGEFGVEPVGLREGTRALYHAGAVTAANFAVVLFDAALEMLEAADIERSQARAMLLPLLRSSVENLEGRDVEEALTGPAARGDHETVDRHRRSLEALEETELAELYDVLAARAEAIATRCGGEDPDAD